MEPCSSPKETSLQSPVGQGINVDFSSMPQSNEGFTEPITTTLVEEVVNKRLKVIIVSPSSSIIQTKNIFGKIRREISHEAELQKRENRKLQRKVYQLRKWLRNSKA